MPTPAATPTDAHLDPEGIIELATHLRPAVDRLARLLRQQNADGLSSTLFFVLASIHRDGPVTLGELAASERVAPPTITAVVAKLEALGYVIRLRDERDGRVWRVQTTDAGEAYLLESRTRRTAYLVDLMRSLDPDDVARLHAAVGPLQQLASGDEPS